MPKQIPLSIHEDMVELFRAADAEDPLFDALSAAARECRVSAEQALDLTDKVMASKLHTVAANTSRARDANFKLQHRATLKVDSARKSAEAIINQIEAATFAPSPPKDAAAALMASEIRAALARLPHEERSKAVSKAIADGQNDLVAAVLHGPELLSGLGPAERELFRDSWRRKNFASEIDRVERLRKAMRATDTAARLMMNFVTSLTDSETARLAEAAEALAKNALAAASQNGG